MSITEAQRRRIRSLAGNCCEYCRVAEADRLSTFQIDHAIPLKHGGTDHTSNLCLACLKCNTYKGPNVAAFDPKIRASSETQRIDEHVFHPLESHHLRYHRRAARDTWLNSGLFKLLDTKFIIY